MWSRKFSNTQLSGRLKCCASIFRLELPPHGNTLRHFSGRQKFDQKFHGENYQKARLIHRWRSVPVPIQAFGVITSSAALIHFVTPSALILYVPPFALSIWLLRRILSRRDRRLQNDRWNQLESYRPVQKPEEWECRNFEIEREATSIIFDAIGSDKRELVQLREQFEAMSQLPKVTSAEKVKQEYRVGPEGLREFMLVFSSKLIDAQEQVHIADVTTVVRQAGHDSVRIRIELRTSDGQFYVLNPNGSDEATKRHTVIEVVGR